jgi:hypothetical protein
MLPTDSIEEWRAVPSVPRAEVSSWGRVRFAGQRTGPIRGTLHERAQKYQIKIGDRTYGVSRLVCEAFHGPPPPDLVRPCCLHIDENGLNNRPENLKWGTQRENCNAPGFLKYCRERFPSRAKLTVADVRAVRSLRAEGLSLRAIATKFGLSSKSNIGDIVNGKKWKGV